MIYVIKIGGNIIDNPDNLKGFLGHFAAIHSHKVLIHGGGKLANQLAEKLNIPQQMVQGRRVTDAETLDVITMVYAGLINKNIVADLSALGCTSLGVCGADADLILADKRLVAEIDYGFVGDIKHVNGNTLFGWLSQGISPVISPVSHNGQGQLLNTNADTIASVVAVALSVYESVSLIYCFEKMGVLLDVLDDTSVIPTLNEENIEKLKEKGLIHSGMLPKLENAIKTVKLGVESVVIGHADALPEIILGKSGTKISLQ
ncbi:MAG: acetylglutamate kinase [Saprospiraceae bacterium]